MPPKQKPRPSEQVMASLPPLRNDSSNPTVSVPVILDIPVRTVQIPLTVKIFKQLEIVQRTERLKTLLKDVPPEELPKCPGHVTGAFFNSEYVWSHAYLLATPSGTVVTSPSVMEMYYKDALHNPEAFSQLPRLIITD